MGGEESHANSGSRVIHSLYFKISKDVSKLDSC
jgi:hypothetical protein